MRAPIGADPERRRITARQVSAIGKPIQVSDEVPESSLGSAAIGFAQRVGATILYAEGSTCQLRASKGPLISPSALTENFSPRTDTVFALRVMTSVRAGWLLSLTPHA